MTGGRIIFTNKMVITEPPTLIYHFLLKSANYPAKMYLPKNGMSVKNVPKKV